MVELGFCLTVPGVEDALVAERADETVEDLLKFY